MTILDLIMKKHKRKSCVHPFKRIHWVGTQVFCNQCKTTIIRSDILTDLVKENPNDSDLGAVIREMVTTKI